MSAPVFGLVLAGGRSSRMGRDKATLAYAGRLQLERAIELLAPRLEQSFVSVRADQVDDEARRAFTTIVDRRADLGPIAGILAAQATHPHAAWLVLACDLPRLDGATLDHLLSQRGASRLATAYRSRRDGLPEPLCAVWEPSSHEPLTRYVEAGGRCPRKFLIGADVELLELPNPQALDNVNTPADYARLMSELATPPRPPLPCRAAHALQVQYFAILREQAGRSEERLVTAAHTPRELYTELRDRHGFTLDASFLRVAVNADFGDWDQPLGDGDRVVFIPPVAGG